MHAGQGRAILWYLYYSFPDSANCILQEHNREPNYYFWTESEFKALKAGNYREAPVMLRCPFSLWCMFFKRYCFKKDSQICIFFFFALSILDGSWTPSHMENITKTNLWLLFRKCSSPNCWIVGIAWLNENVNCMEDRKWQSQAYKSRIKKAAFLVMNEIKIEFFFCCAHNDCSRL